MTLGKTLLRSGVAAIALGGSVVLPAAAHAEEAGAARVAEQLADPQNQVAVTAALLAMSEAIMQIDVEPFARAAEAAGAGRMVRDLPPGATVRDLAGPRAGEMQADLARRAPAMMGAAAGMAGALSEMMPQLRDMAEKMKDAIPRR